jgi:hypothetical protein
MHLEIIENKKRYQIWKYWLDFIVLGLEKLAIAVNINIHNGSKDN